MTVIEARRRESKSNTYKKGVPFHLNPDRTHFHLDSEWEGIPDRGYRRLDSPSSLETLTQGMGLNREGSLDYLDRNGRIIVKEFYFHVN